MFLKRVQVPDFRVLQDVDISFEPDFFPKIFPLGSLNGGGKSTLLQLIFVLLHCSGDPSRVEFINNLLFGFNIKDKNYIRKLAVFEIFDKDQLITIEFFVSQDSSFYKLLGLDQDETKKHLDFSMFIKLSEIEENKISQNNKIKNLESNLHNLKVIKSLEDINTKRTRFQKEYRQIAHLLNVNKSIEELSIEEGYKALGDFIQLQKENLSSLEKQSKIIEDNILEIQKYLQDRKLIYICNYLNNKSQNLENALLCSIKGIDFSQGQSFLSEIAQKVFLTAPITQIFLFLALHIRKNLFDTRSYFGHYSMATLSAQSKLPNFFAYDFFALDLLLDSLKTARDRDVQEASDTGKYGHRYTQLLSNLNSMLTNKKINIDNDFTRVNFKLVKDDEEIELYPEDLSHGELKRLSIYMWLKYRNIEDAIVLMDEIEIALHPDWQYQIVRDLEEWSNSNQYILATHSYELCTALTPDHVKELEPKLLKPKPIQ